MKYSSQSEWRDLVKAKYKMTGIVMSTNPDKNLQTRDHSLANCLRQIDMMRMISMNAAINPRSVYLIQNRNEVISPDIKASLLLGRSLSITIDLKQKKNATVRSEKQSSSALPPKLNMPEV